MTDAVTITLALSLKAEAVAGFCGYMPDMIKDTAAFPGFRSIRIVQHKEDPAQVLFIEQWENEDAYNAYVAWRTERGDMDGMGAMLTAPPRLDIWPALVVAA